MIEYSIDAVSPVNHKLSDPEALGRQSCPVTGVSLPESMHGYFHIIQYMFFDKIVPYNVCVVIYIRDGE